MTPEEEKQLARQTKMAAIVVAVTMVLWVGAQLLGRQLSLSGRYAFLFDFAALAAFFWALVVIFQIWRKRRGN